LKIKRLTDKQPTKPQRDAASGSQHLSLWGSLSGECWVASLSWLDALWLRMDGVSHPYNA